MKKAILIGLAAIVLSCQTMKPMNEVKLLYKGVNHEYGTYDYCYDVNGDNTEDIRHCYPILNIDVKGVQHTEYPFVYMQDFNGNGMYEPNAEILMDPKMDGLNGNEMDYDAWQEYEKYKDSIRV